MSSVEGWIKNWIFFIFIFAYRLVRNSYSLEIQEHFDTWIIFLGQQEPEIDLLLSIEF